MLRIRRFGRGPEADVSFENRNGRPSLGELDRLVFAKYLSLLSTACMLRLNAFAGPGRGRVAHFELEYDHAKAVNISVASGKLPLA